MKSPLVKFIVKYGLIIGVAMSLAFALAVPLSGDPPDYTTMEILGYTSILLSLIAVFFGIRAYRDRHQEGSLSFGTGVIAGIGISAIAGLVLGFYIFAHITWFDPEFMTKFQAMAQRSIEASSDTPQEKAAQLQELNANMESMGGAVMQGLVMFGTVLAFGVVASLISAAILKRNAPKERLGVVSS